MKPFEFPNATKPEDVRIGIYTILKNERKFIDRYLGWAKEADGIWLLDTGSTDGSYEYLCELVEKPEWKDKLFVEQRIYNPFRFDTARTDNMRMVPLPEEKHGVDILIQVDLDEIMIQGWKQAFQKAAFEHPDFDRLQYLYASSHDENGDPKAVFYYNKCHHNHPGYVTKRPVHEFIEWDGEEPCPFEGTYRLLPEVIYQRHFPDRTKSRAQYVSLLELRKQEEPDELTGRCFLVQEYTNNGREADAIRESLEIYAKAASPQRNETGILPPIIKFLALYFEKNCCPQEAEFFYKRAIEFEPTLKDSYICYAQFLVYQGRPLEALEQLSLSRERAVHIKDYRDREYAWSVWKERQIEADAYCWLGAYDLAWQKINEGKNSLHTEDEIREATSMGFYTDYNFIQNKIKERKEKGE